MGMEYEIFVSQGNAYRKVTSGGEEDPSVEINQHPSLSTLGFAQRAHEQSGRDRIKVMLGLSNMDFQSRLIWLQPLLSAQTPNRLCIPNMAHSPGGLASCLVTN